MKLASTVAAAALAISTMAIAGGASAAVVCNGHGYCWHTRTAYTYRPEWGVVAHEDGWKWGAGEHYRWREHSGRGYWEGRRWRRF
jgi:hypothetical protein